MLHSYCYNQENCKLLGADQCGDACRLKIQLQELYRHSNIPPIYLRKEIKLIAPACDKESFLILNDFMKDAEKHISQGDSILIHSPLTGNGKTSWAIKIMRAYFRQIALRNDLRCRGVFICIPDYFDRVVDAISNEDESLRELQFNIEHSDLVIWDDIGASIVKDWIRDKLYIMINRRVLNGKSNIYTTNVDMATLSEHLGVRIMSRIKGECADRIIEFKGKDRRIG